MQKYETVPILHSREVEPGVSGPIFHSSNHKIVDSLKPHPLKTILFSTREQSLLSLNADRLDTKAS